MHQEKGDCLVVTKENLESPLHDEILGKSKQQKKAFFGLFTVPKLLKSWKPEKKLVIKVIPSCKFMPNEEPIAHPRSSVLQYDEIQKTLNLAI